MIARRGWDEVWEAMIDDVFDFGSLEFSRYPT
jgi:hypothetical protein